MLSVRDTDSFQLSQQSNYKVHKPIWEARSCNRIVTINRTQLEMQQQQQQRQQQQKSDK